MSQLEEELQSQLQNTEERINELVQNIEQWRDLEQSFEQASNGLDQAGANIGELAKAAESAAQSHQKVVELLRGAVNVLERSNPDRVHENLKDLNDLTKHSFQEQSQQIGQGFGDIKELTKHSSEGQLNSSKGLRKLIYLLLAFVIILLGIDLFPFVLQLGGSLDLAH